MAEGENEEDVSAEVPEPPKEPSLPLKSHVEHPGTLLMLLQVWSNSVTRCLQFDWCFNG
jgi:hypothetical protein